MVCPRCESLLAVASSERVSLPAADGQLREGYLLRLRCPNLACPLGRQGTVLAEEVRVKGEEVQGAGTG